MTRTPKYRKHSSGKAFVEIDKRRIYLPGKYDSQESRDEYTRLIAKNAAPPVPAGSTLQHLANRYLDYAVRHWGDDSRSSYHDYRRAIRFIVGDAYMSLGGIDVSEFRPSHLKQLQQRMASTGRARETINGVIVKIRTWIKWCVSEELCEPDVLHRLQAVRGLEKGRGDAHDPPPREPVEWRDVQPTFRHLQPVTRDMLWLQWYSGARSRSICQATPAQFETAGDLMLWRPRHKTERKREVVLPLGRRCQAHLRPWLDREPDEFCFSPLDGRNSSNRRYRSAYEPDTYRQAIQRGIAAAQERARKRNAYVPRKWTPHQLRHARGTIVRDRYGIEAAAAILGHSAVDVTELYTARSLALARTVAGEIG